MKLIYRTDTAPPPPPPLPKSYRFTVAGSILQALPLVPVLFRTVGMRNALKVIAKIATPSRAYYAVIKDGRVSSDGWIMFGHCQSYTIDRHDHVIGPINTTPSERGKGLASAALIRGIRYCFERKARFVYIDTTDTNLASQNTIMKSGMALYRMD